MSTLATNPRLPFELISKVMDHVKLSALIRLSHVCRAWRRAARAHPVFWRDIRLGPLDYTPAALDLFLTRLNAHTSGVQVGATCLDYGIADQDLAQQFRSVVLPAIQRNLWRTMRLRIEYSNNLASDIFAALLEPAPVLHELYFARLPLGPQRVLPDDFLGGYAPKLKIACLGTIVLPSPTHTIPAFQNIESLNFQSHQELALPDVLAHFPALRHLKISAISFLQVDAPISFAHGPLASLEVFAGDWDYNPFFFAFYPSDLQAVAHLTCPASGPNGWISAVVSAMEGPLTLTIRDFRATRSDVNIEISSAGPSQRQTRTFHFNQACAQGEEGEEWPDIKEVLFPPEVLARITRFRLLSKHATFVPEIGDELPACEMVELCFDANFSHRYHPLVKVLGYNNFREPYALKFPAVHTVICSPYENSHAGVTIPADELSGLLARVVLPRPSPLKVIELAGVEMSGDIQALEREHGCAVVHKSN